MIRTQVSFDEETYRAAQAEARQRGISFAELSRRAIARLLAEHASDRPWMRYAGVLESGDPKASRSVF